MFCRKLIPFVTFIIYVSGSGELTVLQSPDSIQFTGEEGLDLSTVKNVLSTALGFTIPETERWSGMAVKNPFKFAEAVAVVSVPGATSLGDAPIQGRIYPLRTDEALQDTWEALEWRLSERFPTVDNLTLVRISLDKPAEAEKYFGELSIREAPSLEHLKPKIPEERAFLDQVMLMDAITTRMSSIGIKSDGVPDVYWFDLPGLHTLIDTDTYGENSKRVIEAKGLLSSSILLLSDVLNTIYDDKIVFTTLSSDVDHTRRFRRQTNGTETQVNDKDSEYAAIFNIILWFSVAFVFALLAVSIGIATMDPGRDSIIYRMTSNRMKKDN